jgi:hypothetical protein
MSNTAGEIRVEIRGVQLAEVASCEESEAGVFIALDDPPPVRSILAIAEGAQAPRAFEVTGVVEVPPDGGVRGFVGRFIESDALARYARVGTEHLADGEPEAAPHADGEQTDDDEDVGIQMAMPAPVMVDHDESEPIDVDEPSGTMAHEDDTRPSESESEPESDQAASEAREDGQVARSGTLYSSEEETFTTDAQPAQSGTLYSDAPEAGTSDEGDDATRKGKRRRGRKRR